ncbi:peptidylprolyl isomerase [Solimicrobium silvestre]|uniref:Peptidyl-prolyl cis-trans isomerase n=1 Tax=Solimicrobium silvestre TaxID=2099400 RepID=A0A2S9GVY9_9BURK|nr:peptidylprolyl isomerase [Solimicrobium silvestre]PRC91889.1 Cyclophilin type peptidyl-prolyl cis-trans isomerase/CLD [Solimicrobium silvestre]
MQLRSYLRLPVVTLLSGLLLSTACLAAEPASSAPQVELKTNVGTIVLELYPDAAPKTVKNFLQYVKSGFYTGTIFHRVIDNFMIQGGGMGKDLKEKKMNAPIPLEAQMAIDHGLKNDIGTIAMAREEKPNTATSEFFINVANNDFLNPMTLPDGDPVQFTRHGKLQTLPRAQALLISAGYAPFGRVIQGMDVVNQIKVVQTDAVGENQNLPRKPIIVLSAKILKTHIKPKSIEEQTASSAVPAVTTPVPATEPATPQTAPQTN